MNKQESKYKATAQKMDEALLELIEKKDFSFITIKEICKVAGVNRSTFYLHYENTRDLLNETVELITNNFFGYYGSDHSIVFERLKTGDAKNINLFESKYLAPYLNFVKENKKIYKLALNNAPLGQNTSIEMLKKNVFVPILEQLRYPKEEQNFIIAFYLEGTIAIVKEWLKNDCKEPVEGIIAVIQKCVYSKES